MIVMVMTLIILNYDSHAHEQTLSSGDCVLACPEDTSGQTNPDCLEASCCRYVIPNLHKYSILVISSPQFLSSWSTMVQVISIINLFLLLINPIININLFIILIFNILTKIQLKVTTGNVQETARLQTKVWWKNKIMS